MIDIATLVVCCLASFFAGIAATFGLALAVAKRQGRP